MANPQLENGHFRIANEVWEHIFSFAFTSSEFRLIAAVLRLTYGWKCKQCEANLDEISKLSNLSKRTITTTKADLTRMNVLKIETGNGRGLKTKWSFNKDWESWKKVARGCHLSRKVASRRTKGSKPSHIKVEQGCYLFDDKPVKTKEQLSPKDIIKDNIKTNTPYSPPRDSEAFKRFWEAYPKKKNKGQARKAWKKLKPNNDLVAIILKAIELQKESKSWLKQNGEFIPYPASWINGERWEDEPDSCEEKKDDFWSDMRAGKYEPDGEYGEDFIAAKS